MTKPEIDAEWLRKKIESDPDEGEVGVGFEMFTPEAEAALERLAFAALPRWARDELTALRAAKPLPTPASDDQVEAACAGFYTSWDTMWDDSKAVARANMRKALAAMGSTKR